jgi:hypothetical protein
MGSPSPFGRLDANERSAHEGGDEGCFSREPDGGKQWSASARSVPEERTIYLSPLGRGRRGASSFSLWEKWFAKRTDEGPLLPLGDWTRSQAFRLPQADDDGFF